MKKFILLIAGFLLLMGCAHPKDKFLTDFGAFINETEAHYSDYTEVEWHEVIISYNVFLEELESHKDSFDDAETNQVKEFKERFKKVQIKKEPLKHLIDIFK